MILFKLSPTHEEEIDGIKTDITKLNRNLIELREVITDLLAVLPGDTMPRMKKLQALRDKEWE